MTYAMTRRVTWIAVTALAAVVVALAVLVVLGGGHVEKATLGRAVREMDRRRFARALATLDAVLAADPTNVSALVLRGRCRTALGRYDEAARDFASALKQQPGLPDAEIGRAEVLLCTRRIDAALAAAKNIVAAHPNLADAHALLGRAHHAAFDRAARRCLLVLEEHVADDRAARAAVQLRRGLFGEARTWSVRWEGPGKAAFERSLDAAARHFRLALRHLGKACEGSANMPPTRRPDAWLARARILFEKGDVRPAELTVDRALDLPGVDRVPAILLKAYALSDRAIRIEAEARSEKDPAKAARAGDLHARAVRLLVELAGDHPGRREVRDGLLVVGMRAGRLEEAGRWLVRDSKSVAARYVQAVLALARRDYDAAVQRFSELRGEMKGSPQFHFHFGLAYSRGGDPDAPVLSAAREFQKVLALRPEFVPARVQLAAIHLRRKWYKGAREECDRVLSAPARSSRRDVVVYLLRSEANRGLNRYEDARRDMEQAYDAAPSEKAFLSQALAVIEGSMDEGERARLRELSPEERRSHPRYACAAALADLRNRRGERAVRTLKNLIIIYRRDIMARVHLAHAYMALGRLADAARTYDDAIRMVKQLGRPPSPDLHYGLAAVRLGQGRADAAEKELEKVLELDAGHGAARVRLAALKLRRGGRRQVREALAHVVFAIRHGGDTAAARFLSALIHTVLARGADAVLRDEILDRRRRLGEPGGTRVTPEDLAAERTVSWARAVRNYSRAAELDPRFVFPYDLVLVRAAGREFRELVAACCEGIRFEAEDRHLFHRFLALARLMEGRYAEAVRSARTAVREAEERPAADPCEVLRSRMVLAYALLAGGDFDGARKAVRAATAASPRLRATYLRMLDRIKTTVGRGASRPGRGGGPFLPRPVAVGLGRALLFGRAGPTWFPEALRAYEGLLRRDPLNVAARLHLGDLYLVLSGLRAAEGKTKEAGALLGEAEEANRQALRADSASVSALRNLAAIEEWRGRSAAAAKATPEERLRVQAAAIRWYRQALRIDDTFWLAHLELGALYERCGAPARALPHYRRAVALSPRPEVMLNDYVGVGAGRNRSLARAVARVKGALAGDTLGEAYGEALDAVVVLAREPEGVLRKVALAGHLLSGHPGVRYRLAVAYARTGHKKQAREMLDDLLRSGVPFVERERALALRRKLEGRSG